MTLTARPPRAVSLYLTFISAAWPRVALTWSVACISLPFCFFGESLGRTARDGIVRRRLWTSTVRRRCPATQPSPRTAPYTQRSDQCHALAKVIATPQHLTQHEPRLCAAVINGKTQHVLESPRSHRECAPRNPRHQAASMPPFAGATRQVERAPGSHRAGPPIHRRASDVNVPKPQFSPR